MQSCDSWNVADYVFEVTSELFKWVEPAINIIYIQSNNLF